jgi:ectoine hydroxylase-related dioxygenase (phytanoyl-CoA dioxygenase family)
MEQGKEPQTGRPHEAIERDAYAMYDRLAEGIELSDTDQARVDRAVGAVSERGYAIVTGFLGGARTRRVREELAAVFELPDHSVLKGERLPAGGGDNTIHVCNLFAHTRAADGIATDPLLLKVIEGVLGPAFQLSVACAMRPGPGAMKQVLHRDDVMYGVPRPHFPVVANTLIALDDFTRANGATRVVPGSHRSVEPVDQDAGVVDAEMPAGSLLVWDGAVWHGSGQNRTSDRFRTSLNLNFNLSWLRQQENQYLGIPRETMAGLPELLQRLLGYNRSLFGGVSRTSSLDYFRNHYP